MVVTWGFATGGVGCARGAGSAGPGDVRAGMAEFRGGIGVVVPRGRVPGRLGLLAPRSASGLGVPGMMRARLLLQRSTELVRSSRRPRSEERRVGKECRAGGVAD